MTIEHEQTLLAAILPERRDLLETATRHLNDHHFTDPQLRNLFVMLSRYNDVTGAVMTAPALGDMLRRSGADAGRVLLYEQVFEQLSALPKQEADFRWALQEVREEAAETATGEALTEAMEVLTRGKTIDRQDLKGHEDARGLVYSAFAAIDQDLLAQEAPEGDVRQERTDLLRDYAERKAGTGTPSIRYGFPELDARTSGIANGEMVLFLAYTGEGKTTAVSQLAWSAAVEQGKNVFFATTETLRPQVRRKLLSRHSRLPQFGLPTGLNSKDIKNGSLSPDEEAKLAVVVDDLTSSPAYGKLYVAQFPRGATLATLEQRLRRASRTWQVDLVIVDYLQLLSSDRRRQERRDELSDICRDAKSIAATFDDGRGVPLVSPWQVNRKWKEEADRTGSYTLLALSETAEAEKSSDQVISFHRPPEAPDGRYADVKMQALKVRDGEAMNTGVVLEVDYATSHLVEKRRGSSMADLIEDDLA